MDSNLAEEQTVYTPVVGPFAFFLPRVHQLLLTNGFVFSPLFSALPNLLSYNTP